MSRFFYIDTGDVLVSRENPVKSIFLQIRFNSIRSDRLHRISKSDGAYLRCFLSPEKAKSEANVINGFPLIRG